jgi:gluconate 2-dehydrogenase gamma chain
MQMAQAAATPSVPPLGTEPEAYLFFTIPEAAFIEAAVERLIPTDENGPGARPAGVAYFIDQQLVGTYGSGGKTYKSGPWGHATRSQGYQLRQSPAELYRQGIAAVNVYCRSTYQVTFDRLTAAQQDEALTGIDTGKITTPGFPAKTFFEMLLQNTVEGYFADPVYGGNRDKVGWKMIGFPGVAAAYGNVIQQYDKPYTVAPVSIADVQQHKPVAKGHETMHHIAMENAAKLDKVNR